VDSESAHRRQTQEIISRITLGITDPWNNAEFVALRLGFNLTLCHARILVDDSDDSDAETVSSTPAVTLTRVHT
jgi:hypothetical protein